MYYVNVYEIDENTGEKTLYHSYDDFEEAFKDCSWLNEQFSYNDNIRFCVIEKMSRAI